MKRKRLTLAFLFAITSSFVLSQLPLNFYKITNDEGLSQASVNVIYKDTEGYLWIGTDDGLNRYDGKNVNRFYYQFDNSNTLAANEIYGICEDNLNRIWICHFNGGVSIFDKSKNSFFRLENKTSSKNKLSTSRVYGIAKDKAGNIWVRTVEGISKIDPATFTINNYNSSALADLNLVNIDIVDFQDFIWFGSSAKGLLRVTKAGKHIPFEPGFIEKFGKYVTGIYRESPETLLFCSEKGLFRIERKNRDFEFETILEDPNSFRTANKLFRQKNSPYVWVATERGILIVDLTQRKIIKQIISENIKDNLLSNNVNYVFQDDEENIIIGTGRGVNIASPSTSIFNNFENFFRKIPHFGHPIYAIYELKNQQLLIGTRESGAYIFHPDRLQIVPIKFPYSPTSELKIYHFTSLNDNNFLVCSNKGIWQLKVDNDRVSVTRSDRFPELKQLNDIAITDVVIANDSIAYIAGFTDGFFKWNFRKGFIKQYKKDNLKRREGPVDDQVQKLVFDREKNIILCTKEGFSIYFPSSDTFFNKAKGFKYPYDLPAKNIKDAWDDGVNIWIATYGAGVQKFNRKTKTFSTVAGLPNNSVYAVLPDDRGNLWMPTNKGLAVHSLRDTTKITFTTGDGLPDNEFNGFATYKSSSGNLYFSTLNGIVQTSPERLVVNPIPPKIVLTSLVATKEGDDTTYNTFNASQINLPPGFNSLLFEFAALSYAAPGKNEYKIQLENYDKEWVDLKYSNRRRYNNLAPGNYTLKISGSNNSGVWSKKDYVLKIYIKPFWYQTIWFKVLVLVVIAAVIFMVIRNYLSQRLREQKRIFEKQLAIQEERQRISAEIHDDIGAGLMGVRLLTEMVSKKASNAEVFGEVKKIHTSIGELSSKMREVIWSLSVENDSLESLLYYLQKQATLLFENSGINFHSELPETIPDVNISGEKRRQIYLSVKEALHNTIKHAAGSDVVLSFTVTEQQLFIEIVDDGIGLVSVEGVHNKYGMQNMKSRMEKVGGRFQLSTGNGTKVQFIIPLLTIHENNNHSRRQ